MLSGFVHRFLRKPMTVITQRSMKRNSASICTTDRSTSGHSEQRNADFNASAFSRFAAKDIRAANIFDAFAHVLQAVAAPAFRNKSVPRRVEWLRLKTFAVVQNGEFEKAVLAGNLNLRFGSSGMFDDIMESFLGDEE